MADAEVDLTKIPEDVKEQLHELELELSEGDITRKGYDKKRSRLLAQYVNKSPPQGTGQNAPSPKTAANRKEGRRVTREDHRFHSEVRTEAVMQALAQHNKRVPVMPLPSKRTSVNYKGQERQRDRHDSSSDDDSIFGEDQNRDFLRGGRLRDSGASSSSYSDHSPHHQGREQRPQSAMFFVPGNTSRQAASDIHHSRHSQPISQPPDVTNNAKSTRQADRVGPYAASHISSVRMTSTGSVTGLSDDGPRHQGKVSAKIQQLLNTLKRPKRKPLKEYFVEDDEALEAPVPDPNAPKPEGNILTPVAGEQLNVSVRYFIL